MHQQARGRPQQPSQASGVQRQERIHQVPPRDGHTIGFERANNSRVAGRTRTQFIEMMGQLNLPKPKLIDVAVPANQRLGLRDGESVPHGA